MSGHRRGYGKIIKNLGESGTGTGIDKFVTSLIASLLHGTVFALSLFRIPVKR